MDPETIMLGKYSLPVILSLILGLIFKKTAISDDLKPYISTACGVALGVAAIFYNQVSPVTFPVVVVHVHRRLHPLVRMNNTGIPTSLPSP